MKRRRWDAILDRVPSGERVVGVEVGVWHGKNAVRLLTARPDMTLYLVDPWKAAEPGSSFAESGAEMADFGQEEFDAARTHSLAALEQFGRRAKVIEMESEPAAAEIKRRRVRLDFIFIDGDHSYEGVKRDLSAWLPLARERNVLWIGGHDYANKNGDVKLAVDEVFGEANVEVDDDHCWFVRIA